MVVDEYSCLEKRNALSDFQVTSGCIKYYRFSGGSLYF